MPLAEWGRAFRQVKQFPCSVIKAIWELNVLMSKLTEVRQKWFAGSKRVREIRGVCTVCPVSLSIINPLSRVGRVCIILDCCVGGSKTEVLGCRKQAVSPSRCKSQQPVHSVHLPLLTLPCWSFSSLQSVWFCVLSPALVLTFRKVSQEGGSEFWAFLLLGYPISTAEVP